MHASIGARLIRLRRDRGMSLSELARRSGIGKGTISELERDRRGARLETLFALTTALDAPLGSLVSGAAPDAAPVAIAGASVTATLLGRWDDESGLVEAYRAELTTELQSSPAHAPGVEETVTVVRGRVRVGPDGAGRVLAAGESLRYAAAVPHRFSAVDAPAQILLLMHYPEQRAEHHDH
jgi:transcriptional regulator with XRE-family HTH domain